MIWIYKKIRMTYNLTLHCATAICCARRGSVIWTRRHQRGCQDWKFWELWRSWIGDELGAVVVERMTGNFGQPRERRGHGRTTRLMHERETVVRGFVKCHGDSEAGRWNHPPRNRFIREQILGLAMILSGTQGYMSWLCLREYVWTVEWLLASVN